jgi:hypothetical protein
MSDSLERDAVAVRALVVSGLELYPKRVPQHSHTSESLYRGLQNFSCGSTKFWKTVDLHEYSRGRPSHVVSQDIQEDFLCGHLPLESISPSEDRIESLLRIQSEAMIRSSDYVEHIPTLSLPWLSPAYEPRDPKGVGLVLGEGCLPGKLLARPQTRAHA